MQTITLVTGNPKKLEEWQRIFPEDISLESADIDLDEIQSLDLEAIIIDKAKRAFERLNGPVLVEDISAGLTSLGGLPGPFIKYFELELGADALYRLAKQAGETAVVTCMVAYFDGTRSLTARADVAGTVVPARGHKDFGFDCVFVPDGYTQTFAEMATEEKDNASHRKAAIQILVEQLRGNL
jgi:inosine triphosphate pyrophosphatase